MLHLLVKYTRDHHLGAEPGFKEKRIQWAIDCDREGRFLGVVQLGDVSSKKNRGRPFPRCPHLGQPELIAGGKTRSHFLTEKAHVVALLGLKEGDSKTREKHRFFVDLLRKAAEEIPMPELSGAATMLKNEQHAGERTRRLVDQLRGAATMLENELERIKAELRDAGARPQDEVTLRIEGEFPLESGEWHDWWRRFRAELAKGKPRRKNAAPSLMRCFVSGELVEPASTHPKVKGLADVGGNTTGDALVCFDKPAFQSYTLPQSANAAVSEEVAWAYVAALNHLLSEHSVRIERAKTKIVHWFSGRVPREDDPLPWLQEPPEQDELNARQRARQLLESLRRGERPDLASYRYYALTLSGVGGRIMVRDWMEGQFEKLVANICAWFDDLAITTRDGSGLAPPPKFRAVLEATARNRAELPDPFVAKMWHVAVCGEEIPRDALAKALARARAAIIADDPLNHAHMGLMRAYHVRKDRGRRSMSQDLKPELNPEHPHPAYQCGRLMAVLAGLQKAALGDVRAGVVQRYYAAASTTPALVFGRLLRTAQSHLGKLKPGLAHWFEQQIAEICARLGGQMPRTLDLEEQSLFALGYYQQLAALRTGKSNDSTDEEGKR